MTVKPSTREIDKQFCRMSVEHRILEHGDSWIEFTCDKCGNKQIIKKYRTMAVDSIVNFIMDIYDKSEAVKQAIWIMIADHMDKSGYSDEE